MHKAWDVCECGHRFDIHTHYDLGPCNVVKCACPRFAWKQIPIVIDDLKDLLKELDD